MIYGNPFIFNVQLCEGKVILLQARCDPEGG